MGINKHYTVTHGSVNLTTIIEYSYELTQIYPYIKVYH